MLFLSTPPVCSAGVISAAGATLEGAGDLVTMGEAKGAAVWTAD